MTISELHNYRSETYTIEIDGTKMERTIHYDGEPDVMGTQLSASIEVAALNVVVPKDFKG